MKEVRVAVVGAGWMGRAHATAFRTVPMVFGREPAVPVLEVVADTIDGFAAIGTEHEPVGVANTSAFEAALGLAGPPLWPPGPYPILAVPRDFPELAGYRPRTVTSLAQILDGTTLPPAERLAGYRAAIAALNRAP
jgi:hypothetical protein